MSEQGKAEPVQLFEVTDPEDDVGLNEALLVLCDGVGDGSYSLEGLRAVVSDPDQLLLAARLGARSVGALVASLVGDDRGWYNRFGVEAAQRVKNAARPVNLSGTAVVDGYRKQGIGRAMIERALSWGREKDCDWAVAVSWLHPGVGASRGLLVRGGFESVVVAPDVYLEDSLHDGLVCTYCAGPCHCRGELFLLGLNSSQRAATPGSPARPSEVESACWDMAHDPLYSFLDVHDLDGRPLGERTASESALRGVEMELRSCPYRGSRHEHELPMNVSGLRQASGVWGDALDAFRRVRWEFKGVDQASFSDVFRMARALACGAAYQVRRGKAITGGVAATYKVSLGINQSCEFILLQSALAGVDVHRPASGDEIIRVTEENGLYISAKGVCAGSNPMVREALDTLILPQAEPEAPAGRVASELGDIAHFVRWTNLECTAYLVKVGYVAALLDIRQEHGTQASSASLVRFAQLQELLEAAPSVARRQLARSCMDLAAALTPQLDELNALAELVAHANREQVVTEAASKALGVLQRELHRAFDGSDAGPSSIPLHVLELIGGEPACS